VVPGPECLLRHARRGAVRALRGRGDPAVAARRRLAGVTHPQLPDGACGTARDDVHRAGPVRDVPVQRPHAPASAARTRGAAAAAARDHTALRACGGRLPPARPDRACSGESADGLDARNRDASAMASAAALRCGARQRIYSHPRTFVLHGDSRNILVANPCATAAVPPIAAVGEAG